MKWQKKGLIFNPIGKFSWAEAYALQPTPIIFENIMQEYIVDSGILMN